MQWEPDPCADAVRAAAIPKQVRPQAPVDMSRPWQEPGILRARPLPYSLTVGEAVGDGAIRLRFSVDGEQAAVFHVYDRTDLTQASRRFTIEPGRALDGRWTLDR